MKLSIDILSLFRPMDKAIKEAEDMADKQVFICYYLGYLTACKMIIYSIWPASSRNEGIYTLLEEKAKELQVAADEICKKGMTL